MGARVDMAVLRRDRALALGVCDSIQHVTGYAPTSNKPRIAATVLSYLLGLSALVAILSLAARQ